MNVVNFATHIGWHRLYSRYGAAGGRSSRDLVLNLPPPHHNTLHPSQAHWMRPHTAHSYYTEYSIEYTQYIFHYTTLKMWALQMLRMMMMMVFVADVHVGDAKLSALLSSVYCHPLRHSLTVNIRLIYTIFAVRLCRRRAERVALFSRRQWAFW